jgi:hypothetical protein
MTTVNLYSMTVPAMQRGLNNLTTILDKAQAFADEKKVDPAVLPEQRLILDMLPFKRQVQIACDFAKGAVARLSGAEPPKFDDTEATLADLKLRIAKTLDYMQSVPVSALDGSESRVISLKVRGNDVQMDGYTYVTLMVLPNFYFHLTTAYNLLRMNGVQIGKSDFIGAA